MVFSEEDKASSIPRGMRFSSIPDLTDEKADSVVSKKEDDRREKNQRCIQKAEYVQEMLCYIQTCHQTTQAFVRMLSVFVTSGNIKGMCYCSNPEIFKTENTEGGGYIKDNLYSKSKQNFSGHSGPLECFLTNTQHNRLNIPFSLQLNCLF